MTPPQLITIEHCTDLIEYQSYCRQMSLNSILRQICDDQAVKEMSRSVKSTSEEDEHALFIFDRESVVLKKWQILEFDGKPYYAFVPENDVPVELDDLESLSEDGDEEESRTAATSLKPKIEIPSDEELLQNDESFYDHNLNSPELHNDLDDEPLKPLFINDITREQKEGDLYEVKIEGSMITIEKLAEDIQTLESCDSILPEIKQGYNDSLDDIQEGIEDIPDDEFDEQAQEVPNFSKKARDFKGRPVIFHGKTDDIQGHRGEIVEYIGVDPEDDDEETVDDVEPTQDHNQISENVQEEQESENRDENQDENRNDNRCQTRSQNLGLANLKCKACSEIFGSQIAFRKHVAWTHKKKVCIQEDGAYICAVCDYRTLKKSLFAAHLERKHETWPRKGQGSLVFPCAVCGFVCRSKHSLQSHFIRKHTDKYEHQCKFCPKKFKVKGDLTNHVRFHHKEKPIHCDVCGKLCQNTGSLYVHQKWAHYKPKFECPICKRRMVTQENLDQHMVTQHEKREKIVCAECGKTFTKKDSFKRHMAVHTGSKPHACPICQKPFARQSQLRQHVLIHTGKRPFVCDICGKAFTQKPGLICHRKTHPGPHPPLPVMPIADLVNEFTAEYLQENAGNNVGEDYAEEDIEEEAEEEVSE